MSILDIIKPINNSDNANYQTAPTNGQYSIKEKCVLCLECGKEYRVLTKKHLSIHNLTPEEYKEKWGIKKDTPLIARETLRERQRYKYSLGCGIYAMDSD